jgi:ribosomal protein L29
VTTLGKRLTALEEIAEQLRRREMRDLVLSLPEARDLTPAEMEAAVDEALRYLAELRSQRP